MAAIKDQANSVYRDFVTDGVPASGPNDPDKADIRGLFSVIDVAVAAAQAGITIVPTTAARDAFYATPANQSKLVYVNNNNGSAADPTNGVYEYVGGSARIAQGFYQGVVSSVAPLQNEIDAINAGFVAKSTPYSDNQLLRWQIIPNVFRSITDGALVNSPDVATTGDMPVVKGRDVIFLPGNDFFDGRAGIGFRDADGNIMPGYVPAPVASGRHNPPPGAATWFVNFRLSDLGQLYVGVGNTVPSSIPTPGGGSTGDSQWIGKKWAMSGDSIVNGNLWAPTVQAKLGIGTYTNWGVGGTTMRQILTDRTSADFAGLDLYGISTGTNDFGLAQTPIGSPTDTPSNATGATFWAAIRYNIETVLGWNPSMRMFMMTPLKRSDEFTAHPGGVPLKAYRDAILAAGEMYGVPVYDQYSRSGIGPQTFANFLRDERSTAGYYLHPNEVGGVLIGTQMYPWINGLGHGS